MDTDGTDPNGDDDDDRDEGYKIRMWRRIPWRYLTGRVGRRKWKIHENDEKLSERQRLETKLEH